MLSLKTFPLLLLLLLELAHLGSPVAHHPNAYGGVPRTANDAATTRPPHSTAPTTPYPNVSRPPTVYKATTVDRAPSDDDAERDETKAQGKEKAAVVKRENYPNQLPPMMTRDKERRNKASKTAPPSPQEEDDYDYEDLFDFDDDDDAGEEEETQLEMYPNMLPGVTTRMKRSNGSSTTCDPSTKVGSANCKLDYLRLLKRDAEDGLCPDQANARLHLSDKETNFIVTAMNPNCVKMTFRRAVNFCRSMGFDVVRLCDKPDEDIRKIVAMSIEVSGLDSENKPRGAFGSFWKSDDVSGHTNADEEKFVEEKSVICEAREEARSLNSVPFLRKMRNFVTIRMNHCLRRAGIY